MREAHANYPDRWCLLDLGKGVVKVMAYWAGSYLYGAEWKVNSGIVSIEDNDDTWRFLGHSDSVYECRKNGYGLTGYSASVLQSLDLTAMEEDAAIAWIQDNIEQKES